jgi:hippurate hydrolase
MGCTTDPTVSIRDHEYTPAAYNDPGLTSAAVEVLRKVVGIDNVLVQKARMGGEDFGRYAKHLNVPGFMFLLGSIEHARYENSLLPDGTPLPSLHSSKYIPDAEPTIATGVRSLSMLAISLMATPE